MQLKNDMASLEILYNTASLFYAKKEGCKLLIFEQKAPDEYIEFGYYIRFLLDGKHVVEYRIANDRGFFLSILSLAIGPHYFPIIHLWDYENSQRLSLDASTDAIENNLKLLDEFLGGR